MNTRSAAARSLYLRRIRQQASLVPELQGRRGRTRWKVRVHWGIILAMVASLTLWLSIGAFVGL